MPIKFIYILALFIISTKFQHKYQLNITNVKMSKF